jgi:hypothetical protein
VRFLIKLKKTHNLRIKVCFLLAEKSILFLLVKILKAENKLFIQINGRCYIKSPVSGGSSSECTH